MSISGVGPIDDGLMKMLMQVLKEKSMGDIPPEVLRDLVIEIIKQNIDSQKATAEELIELISSYDFDKYA